MTEHRLKSWPEFFLPVLTGRKTFELRKNDRNFAVGDVLVLEEWEPNTEKYTGRRCICEVIYMLTGAGSVGTIAPLKGLSIGYAILGLGIVQTPVDQEVREYPADHPAPGDLGSVPL